VVKDIAEGAGRESKVSHEEIAKARAKARGEAEPTFDAEEPEESERKH